MSKQHEGHAILSTGPCSDHTLGCSPQVSWFLQCYIHKVNKSRKSCVCLWKHRQWCVLPSHGLGYVMLPSSFPDIFLSHEQSKVFNVLSENMEDASLVCSSTKIRCSVGLEEGSPQLALCPTLISALWTLLLRLSHLLLLLWFCAVPVVKQFYSYYLNFS